MVLFDTFEQLDNIIQISNDLKAKILSNQAQYAKYNDLLPDANELILLQSALARLFESTVYMDDYAIKYVLEALGNLIINSLSHYDTLDQSIPTIVRHNSINISHNSVLSIPRPKGRLFALVNLLATIEHNMFRIGTAKLWETAISHLSVVIVHSNAAMRKFGILALSSLAQIALKDINQKELQKK